MVYEYTIWPLIYNYKVNEYNIEKAQISPKLIIKILFIIRSLKNHE